MRVLLPPSETKRPDGGNAHFHGPLLQTSHKSVTAAHERVRAALEELSRDTEVAVAALKLGAKSRAEVSHNLALEHAPRLAAVERYTGVLYDSLEPATLSDSAREWLHRHVFIQSALFGTISAGTPIPPYRLSATTRLPALQATLRRVWNAAYADLHPTQGSLTLDLRSKDYASLAPIPDQPDYFTVEVVERGPDGIARPLNHFNKQTKGLFVRALSQSLGGGEETPTTLEDLDAWATRHGWEIQLTEQPRQLRLLQRVR